MSRIGFTEAAGQCHLAGRSVYGMYLRGHTFKTVQVGLPEDCYFKCEQEARCQSYNVIIGPIICELNSRTKEARPEDFVPDQRRFYMKRLTKRGTRHFFNAYEGSSKTSWKRGVLPFLSRGCYSNYKIL